MQPEMLCKSHMRCGKFVWTVWLNSAALVSCGVIVYCTLTIQKNPQSIQGPILSHFPILKQPQ